MPTSGASPSQIPNTNATWSERRHVSCSPPSAIAVRKLSRLRVNPKMRRLPSTVTDQWEVRISRGLFSPKPRDIQYDDSLLLLRQREGEQRAPLAGAEHPGQEPFRPRAPAGRHGDVLPSVDAVAARAAVVAAAALELPQLLSGGRVERVELAGRLAREHEIAARRQDRRAHRDVVAPAPPFLAGAG